MPLAPHLPAAQADDHAALVVALDAGDLAGTDLARAQQLTASCDGCAALVADLAAIRDAMGALPIPARRRDYRLSAEDAARLRPSAWRRVLAWLASPGSGVRPLATGLATLGVVGLLLTAGLPNFGFGFAGSAAAPVTQGSRVDASGAPGAPAQDFQGTYAPEAAPSGAPMPQASPPPNQLSPGGVAGAASSAGPDEGRNATSGGAEGAPGEKAAATDTAGSSFPAGAAISIALLVAGLGLFVARALARRRLA